MLRQKRASELPQVPGLDRNDRGFGKSGKMVLAWRPVKLRSFTEGFIVSQDEAEGNYTYPAREWKPQTQRSASLVDCRVIVLSPDIACDAFEFGQEVRAKPALMYIAVLGEVLGQWPSGAESRWLPVLVMGIASGEKGIAIICLLCHKSENAILTRQSVQKLLCCLAIVSGRAARWPFFEDHAKQKAQSTAFHSHHLLRC